MQTPDLFLMNLPPVDPSTPSSASEEGGGDPRALLALARESTSRSDYAEGRILATIALELARRSEEVATPASALNILGAIERRTGGLEVGRAAHEEALAIARR